MTAVTLHPCDSHEDPLALVSVGGWCLHCSKGFQRGRRTGTQTCSQVPDIQIAKQETEGAPAPGPRG